MRQFYGHLEKMRSFCRKNHVRKIPLFWGGFLGGGGSADFIFMGARIFLKFTTLRFLDMEVITIARFRAQLPRRECKRLRIGEIQTGA